MMTPAHQPPPKPKPKPAPKRKPSHVEEMLRNIEAYADDLRELIRKLKARLLH